MTAKKAQTSTMILLVVPLGFSTGTELLKTKAQSSQMDLPMVNLEPPAPGDGDRDGGTSGTGTVSPWGQGQHHSRDGDGVTPGMGTVSPHG